jgi:hypothetical protein
VLAISDRNVVFSHQGYFDYLVAQKVLSEIRRRKIIVVAWLKDTDQSLFRRDQLRNVLMLLRDEDEQTYCRAIEEIIASKNIRFHLKHLILNLLGNSDPPLDGESQLVMRLLEDRGWHGHIKDLVLWNKTQWFRVLHKEGIVSKWLRSNDKEQADFAIRLMSVALPECSEEIYEIIRPLEKMGGEWLEKVASILGWRYELSDECRELFAMWARLMQRGVLVPRFLHWAELAKKNPRRCLLLFRICISRLVDRYLGLAPDTAKDKLPKLECLAWHDLDAISEAAKKEPNYAWRSLIRFWQGRGKFISDMMKTFHAYEDYEWDEDVLGMREKLELPLMIPAIERILTVAGQTLAHISGEEFLKDITVAYGCFPKRFKRAAIRALAETPDECADKIMLWLCEHPESFKLGSGYYVSSWEPVEWLIKRFAMVCSENVIRRLEETLLCYKDAELKETYTRKVEIFREYNAVICNEFGRTQYVLLSCIPKDRLSEKAKGFLGQLERKFARYGLHKAREFQGGFVGSPIPSEKLTLVTDEEWLRIISRNWSERERRWKQMGPEHVGEASHEHFAADFGHIAEQQPQRFADLALHIPKDVYPGYLSRILRAIALTKPPDSLKQPEKDAWQLATGEQIETVLDYVGYSEDRDQAISFCDLLEKRSDAKWPARVLDRLINYATKHPDPQPETFSVQRVDANKQYIPDVVNSALNCVRGRAAMTMAKLLFEQPALLSTFEGAIGHLVKDASPAVRIAAMDVCLPILNIDRNQAVAYFVTACQMQDDQIFEGHSATTFISYAWHTHLEKLKPIIERMAKSKNPKVAKIGAAWATAIWLQKGEMEELKKECCCGSVHQRKGVAEVAVHWMNERANIEKHIEIIRAFFNDEDAEVRREAGNCFRKEERLHIPEVVKLAVDYVESAAFDNDPDTLFYGLDDYTGNLKTYAESLFKAGEKLAGPLANVARNFATGIGVAVTMFAKLMLRLYEQTYRSGDKQVNERCLSIWDRLLESGIVETRVLEEIES